ncbi:hypothetical protein BJX64DRAFT_288577 [Aspergillus heterothallicus]
MPVLDDIFRQIGTGWFANNRNSAALVNNHPLRAYTNLFKLDLYTASNHVLKHLLGPSGASYAVHETAWQDAPRTTKTRWD